jgi:hypothetical protein
LSKPAARKRNLNRSGASAPCDLGPYTSLMPGARIANGSLTRFASIDLGQIHDRAGLSSYSGRLKCCCWIATQMERAVADIIYLAIGVLVLALMDVYADALRKL